MKCRNAMGAPIGDHQLPSGFQLAGRGGCQHTTAETMSRSDFSRLPIKRCVVCDVPLGRVCPDCGDVY